MNYELALKLKNAGFPQAGVYGHLEYFIDGQRVSPTASHLANQVFYCPTLEELISALGKDFDALYSNYSSLTDMQGEERWRADATDQTGYSVIAKSPVEALAKLWLTVQSKNA